MIDIGEQFKARPPNGSIIMFILQEHKRLMPIYYDEGYTIACKTDEGVRFQIDFDTLDWTSDFGGVLSFYKDGKFIASISDLDVVDIQYHKDYRNIKWKGNRRVN